MVTILLEPLKKWYERLRARRLLLLVLGLLSLLALEKLQQEPRGECQRVYVIVAEVVILVKDCVVRQGLVEEVVSGIIGMLR